LALKWVLQAPLEERRRWFSPLRKVLSWFMPRPLGSPRKFLKRLPDHRDQDGLTWRLCASVFLMFRSPDFGKFHIGHVGVTEWL
jgi:hypothetical protein